MTKILVVEDEPAIAESIAYSLRRDGYTAQIVGTVAAAEREIATADLVILDLMRPDGSGQRMISNGIDGKGADHPRWVPTKA